MNIIKKISVIIPVFNQQRYIERCLRSILSQTFDSDAYEVIVIDDCSKDNTLKNLEKYKDNIIILKNEKNYGLPYSLNKAIRASRAQYIVRLDSDDYVNDKFLEILHLFISTNKSTDAFACDYYLVDEDENIIKQKNCIDDPIGCGIIFNTKDLFDIGLYDIDFLLNEEKDLRIRFEKKYKISRIALPLYRYRKHQTNITNNKLEIKSYNKKIIQKHKI